MKKNATSFAALFTFATVLLSSMSVSAAGVKEIPYHLASEAEGKQLLAENQEYYRKMSQSDLDYRLQEKGAAIEDLQAFAQSQVRTFDSRKKRILEEGMRDLQTRIAARGITLPQIENLTFVLTTQEEECGSTAYTHKNQIYIGERALDKFQYQWAKERFCFLLAHELFHCLTRQDSEFRRKMYSLIGFTIAERDFECPESLRAQALTNPDVPHHNSYATFRVNGKDVKCFVMTIVTRPFEREGDSFFGCFEPRMVSIDDPRQIYTPAQVENFWEVFGKNTRYVIDPEEVLADNFALAITIGADEEEYPSPELIKGIIKLLKK